MVVLQNLGKARSHLYRSRFLEGNAHFTVVSEIDKISKSFFCGLLGGISDAGDHSRESRRRSTATALLRDAAPEPEGSTRGWGPNKPSRFCSELCSHPSATDTAQIRARESSFFLPDSEIEFSDFFLKIDFGFVTFFLL